MEWLKGDVAGPGAVFKGHNRNGGKSWTTTCTVTDAEPGRVFAFDVRSAVDARRALALRHRADGRRGVPGHRAAPGTAGPAGSASPRDGLPA